jgi:hypothetical protein
MKVWLNISCLNKMLWLNNGFLSTGVVRVLFPGGRLSRYRIHGDVPVTSALA